MKIRTYTSRTHNGTFRLAGTEVTVSPAQARAAVLGQKDAEVWDEENSRWLSPNSTAAAKLIEAERKRVNAERKAAAKPEDEGLEAHTVEELKEMLAARDLPVSGNKAELVERLLAADAGEGDDEEE